MPVLAIALAAALSLAAAGFPEGWTQIDIDPASDIARTIAVMRERIDRHDLQEESSVLAPHVTVRYGLLDNDVARLRAWLASLAPFEIEFGRVAAFAPNRTSQGAATLFVEVESAELLSIYRESGGKASFKAPDFDVYRPHVTLAFVHAGAVDRYAGDARLRGVRMRVDAITIVLKNGRQERVALHGRR